MAFIQTQFNSFYMIYRHLEEEVDATVPNVPDLALDPASAQPVPMTLAEM